MGKVFGIDLGTTYSCIAYIDEYGKAEVLKNCDGEHTTPSVVYMETKENIIVGQEAKRAATMEADKVAQFVKRKIGKEDDKVLLGGDLYPATEVSAYILKKLVGDANAELLQTGVIEPGEEIKDVVITCPAYFGMNEREATKKAGEIAKLNVLDVINEPTAAAISYGVSGKEKSETVLIYDLGGGTFDITVMNIDGGNITVICTGGDDELGGKDWDQCFMDYLIREFENECGEDISEELEILDELTIEVESWKKSLTNRAKTNVTIKSDENRFRKEITREVYEDVTKGLLTRTKNLLDDMLKTAEKQGYPINKIDKVLLVGGSSKMPQVSAMLTADYGVTPILADPDEAVAKGAAVYANNQKAFNDFLLEEAKKENVSVETLQERELESGELGMKFTKMSQGDAVTTKIKITNVLSRTYGIASHDEKEVMRIFNMLKINDKLPATCTESFYTMVENQIAINMPIYESVSKDEVMDIDEKTPITTVLMEFNSKVPKNTEIEVTLTLDNSGILHIVAHEKYSNSRLDTSFKLSNDLSEEELNTALVRMSRANIE